MCVRVRECVRPRNSARWLPGDAELDNEQDMMSVPMRRVNLRVRQCVGSGGMFLFTYCSYYSSVSCSKEFPLQSLCVAQKPQILCVFGVCVCKRESKKVLLMCFIFMPNVDSMIVWRVEFINLL